MIARYSRRELLARASKVAGAALLSSAFSFAAETNALSVAYAGSMGSLMEGPIKSACAKSLHLEMHGEAQGSSALAQLIAGGGIRPDVFIPVTPGPARVVLRAGKADSAQPVARTEMVIAYSPKSRFAAKFGDAANGKANWWEVLQQPGLRFGRSDPGADPQGRNIIFVMMLAAKFYKQPDLVTRILGPTNNQQQIFSEPTVSARLQSGQLDAASAFKIQPGPFNLPYISLPAEINLSGENLPQDVALTLEGKTYRPEPLIYYSLVLKDAPNPEAAAAFAEWLRGSEAQAIFTEYAYDPPGNVPTLHA